MSSNGVLEEKRNVIVTGFGPFGVHSVNNSWECVQLLKSTSVEEKMNVSLIIEEIPVIYKAAEEIVPKLWDKYDPVLVIHVGVHNEDSIKLEERAYGKDYFRLDENDCLPLEGQCTLGSEEVIETKLNLSNIKVKCENTLTSNEAGRYLCEYTYFISLSRDSSRTLFVHVPPCFSCVSKDFIVKQLQAIIEQCLNEISKDQEKPEKPKKVALEAS